MKISFLTASPISHIEENDGITSKFRRLKIRDVESGKINRIPFISGNSIRGLLRRYGAKYLLEKLEIKSEDLPESVYYVLFSGGTLHAGIQINVADDFKSNIRKNLPLISLLGAIVHQEIVPGKINVDLAIPVVKETKQLTGLDGDKSCWDILQEIPFSRRDDLEDKKTQQVQQMQYYIESIIPGITFLSGVVVRNITEVEKGCLNKCLSDFKTNGVVGGNLRMGFGKIQVDIQDDLDYSVYEEFLITNKQKISDFLLSLKISQLDDNIDMDKFIKKQVRRKKESDNIKTDGELSEKNSKNGDATAQSLSGNGNSHLL